MSKATLEFNLPEERAGFETAINSGKYVSAIHDYLQWLRQKIKHEGYVGFGAEEVRDKIYECLRDYDIDREF